ncbi:MAG: hypothetical protein AB7T38_09080 [Nitrospirales bacterium]
MRTALMGLIGLLILTMAGCLLTPPPEAYETQRLSGKPMLMEQGTRIDEAKARAIKTGVTTQQDIRMGFGKPEIKYSLDDPESVGKDYNDPHGCVEEWMYNYRLSNMKEHLLGIETLSVAFTKDNTVCRWSLLRGGMDLKSRDPDSLTGRPIDEAKAKTIQNGVTAKQDIEAGFGKANFIGFGNDSDDPKGCDGELWRYSYNHMDLGPGRRAPGQAGGNSEYKFLDVKFNEQSKVCHSVFKKMNF